MTDLNRYQSWLESCTAQDDKPIGGQPPRTRYGAGGGHEDEVSSRLRREARAHFESLSSSSSSPPPSPETSAATSTPPTRSSPPPGEFPTTVAQDVSVASSTPNGALALLVSTLGPACCGPSSSGIDARVRALRCLAGALEGSAELTHGMREGVGRFLLGQSRPESRDGEAMAEGGDDEMEEADGRPADYVDAANLTPEQVTERLQAMERAHEEREKYSAGGSGEGSFVFDDARDAATTGLTALLRSRLEMFPTQQSRSLDKPTKSSPLGDAVGVVHQSMGLRLELAMSGVRRRCLTEGSDQFNGQNGMWGGAGAGYETNDPDLNIEDGLSQLSRLKRSLCFNLLEGALDGFNEDETKRDKLLSQSESQPDAKKCAIPPSLWKSMSAFASLSSSCIHGETDPRCLLQIMRLLNKIQRVMLPLFALGNEESSGNADEMNVGTTEEEATTFPSTEMFDAVAPYYPVQFTPPKNDPHGITRDMLQDALMAVLCERGAFYKSRTMGGKQEGGGEETMIALAARMFLERLEPPKSSEYDPPSNGSGLDVEDKLDAVRDLSTLLLPRSTPFKNRAAADMTGDGAVFPEREFSPNATRVAPLLLSELSLSMARVHEEAVSSDAKSLASAIRKLSSSLARALERAATNDRTEFAEVDTAPLWEACVVDVLRRLSPALGSSPQGTRGRASTAYLASLAAEGGLMTLKRVLEGCYPRFLGVLSPLDGKRASEESADDASGRQKARDEEKMAAAMRGVAALVSSCRVALQRWQAGNPGVRVHPHPLSPYIASTIEKISFILHEDPDGFGPLSMAAVGALESVLTSADLNGLEEGNSVSLEESLSFVSRVVLGEEGTTSEGSKNLDEWKVACARVLGAALAVGLCREKGSNGALANTCGRMETLAVSLLPEILASATLPSGGSLKSRAVRYDWMVLAGACANGSSQVSQKIVSELISSMIAALRSCQEDQGAPAMALAYLVRNGGRNVGAAFHGLLPPGPTPFDVINEMCKPLHQGSSEDEMMDSQVDIERGPLRVGMSVLRLPGSGAKEEEAANDAIERAGSILPYLIPAYECPSSASSRCRLAQFVNQILPPLSVWDEVKLYVAFPLLAAVLNGLSEDWKTLDSATLMTLRSMITYLAQFSISSYHDAHARSAAASCLFSILFHCCQDDGCDGDVHLFRKLSEEAVYPELTGSTTRLKEEIGNSVMAPTSSSSLLQTSESLHSSLSRVEDTISFLGILGSAAACKGGPFSLTADKISSFLIELACTGTSQLPFTEATMELVTPSDEGQRHPLLDPASHVYILPASAFGGMLSVQNGGPFWRQRMAHKTLPILLKALQLQAKSQNPPSLGTLAVVCHMVCCLPASILGKSNIQQILPTMVAGLVYFSKNLNALAQSEMISSKPTDILSIILAALAKTLTISPEYVTKFIGVIIPSLLLLSSSTESSETYIPKQLLVFQCLETVATLTQARNSILREKDQVVAVLSGVVDHPSMMVRNGVVQVRNVWYTLA